MGSDPRFERGQSLFTKVSSERSDEVFLDFLTGVLLALEPARHPAPARPAFVRLGVAVLRFHFALPTFPTIATTVGIGSRTTTLLSGRIAKSRQLFLEFAPLGGAGLVMLVLKLSERTVLLLEREFAKPRDHGANCKLSCHVETLSIPRDDEYYP
jgi:hypothetical protein